MLNPTLEGLEQTSAPTKSATQTSVVSTFNLPVVSTFNLPESSPKRLNDKHFADCCGTDQSQKQRGLNPDWIAANCYSVSEQEATELLGYKAKSGGIIISGANGQYQFRPDRPWRSEEDQQKKRKAPKYRTAKGDEYDALLPRHPDEPHFWLDLERLKAACWQIDGVPHLLVTEGGFKAICPTSEGIPTMALMGVEMGLTPSKLDPQGKRYLVSALERFAQEGFGFILGFDADISTKESVQRALYKLGFQLKKFNVSVYVMPEWDERLGKGIDDFIVNQGIEKFREILARSITFEAWALEREKDGGKLSPLQQAWRVVNKEYADRLRFNELTLTVELDGEAADLDGFYLDLELTHNCSISKDKAYDLAVRCAKQNPYHPVKDYLNHVANTAIPIDIKTLSQRYFGTLDPIYNEMLYRHLIGSVARVFEPGCKKDEAVILKGKQGALKSTFWKVLYGEDFFSDSLKGTDRDDLLVLHQYWALELAEFETITSKKQAGELKAFLSASTDTFREPYGRHSKPRKRQSVIVGSVNPDCFLVDETGNRRYWVIPVDVARIELEALASERDAIWAAAVNAYRNGERWHLTPEEEMAIGQLNESYRHQDAWEVPISNYLLDRSTTTTYEVLIKALDFDNARVSKRDEMRVGSILSGLGWKHTRAIYLGKRQRVWVKETETLTQQDLGQPGQPGDNLDSLTPEVVHTESLTQKDLGQPGQPGQPFSQTLPDTQPHLQPDVPDSALPFVPVEVVQVVQPLQGKADNLGTTSGQPTEIAIDYSTFPHLTSNDYRAHEKRALAIKESMVACSTAEELANFRQNSGYSQNEIDWVARHALTPDEKTKVNEAARLSQPSLLDEPANEYQSRS